MTRLVSNANGIFYSTATRIAGSISVAHGLGKTPAIVIITHNVEGITGGGAALGTHDATDLEINCGSTGISHVIFAM